MANRRNDYDECKTCICNDCTAIIQCNTCEDCSGEAVEREAPFAFHKTECPDFIPEDPAKGMDEESRYFCKIANSNSESIKTKHEAARKLELDHVIRYADFCERINKKYNKGYDPNEMTSYQTTRIDEIENSVFDLLKVMTCNPNMEWDMSLIGPIADTVADTLTEKGFVVYYPALVYDENDNGSILEFQGL